VLPVVFASLLLSLAAFVVNETLVLANERALAPERSEDRIAFRRGSFWYHRGNTVYNIHDADAASRTLLGVSVFRLGADGRLLQSLHARSVSVEAGTWVLEDAVRRTFDPARPDAPPRVERVFEKVAGLGSARDLALLDARIERLSLFGLREYIAARAAEGRDTVVARGHLHRRLTDPLGVSLFAWLALPLGFAVERTRSLAVSGLVGIAWVSVFYSLRTAGSALADGGVAAGALAPWLLLAGFGGIGGWRLARVPG
jgi:lipopolysaccharide export LptBFGC system permease protein LptF